MVYLVLYFIGVFLFPFLLRRYGGRFATFLINSDSCIDNTGDALALTLFSLFWPLPVVVILLTVIYNNSSKKENGK